MADVHVGTACLESEATGVDERVIVREKETSITMHVPHELRAEFSDDIRLVERLVRTNYLFRRLAARYDEINSSINRIECEDEPTSDEVLERLKKRRLKLKDDIAAMIAQMKRRM